MTSREAIITGIGLVTITVLGLLSFPAANYFDEPTSLDYDEIRIDAERLKDLRSRTAVETIFFHSIYDKDLFWEEDDIHLAPTAWKNADGPNDYEWVNIENPDIFERGEQHTLEKVIVSRSNYCLNREQLRYLTEEVGDVVYFKFVPIKPEDSSFVNYRVIAYDRNNTEIQIDDSYEFIKPSPPAKFTSR